MKTQRWYPTIGVVILLVGLLLPLMSAHAQAGGGPVTYGSSVTGTITADMPLVLYTFNGSQGDLVHVNVYGQPGGLVPAFDLVGPTQQTIANSQPDTFAAPQDAALAILLPTTGAYSLLVTGTNGTTGDFILQLQGRPPVNALPLLLDQAITATVLPNAQPQWYSFTAADCPTTLTAFDPSTGKPYTFPYIVKVRDEHGTPLAHWRGGETVEDRITVAPLTGPYEVEVWADEATQTGSIALLITCADAAPECPPAADTTQPPDPAMADAECPACPPCPGDEPDDPGRCADFYLRFVLLDDGSVRVSWAPVEGANAAIVSVINEAGDLVYARMVNDVLEDTLTPATLGGPGTYTVRVTVGSEELGYDLCGETGSFTLEGEGPVDWGPAAGDEDDDDECVIEMVAPLETMANGLQTFFWSSVEGADSYWLRIYGQFDTVVAEGVISAPATSMTLDVSEASIGAGYGGDPDFYAQIDALRDGERWCSSGVRLSRNP